MSKKNIFYLLILNFNIISSENLKQTEEWFQVNDHPDHWRDFILNKSSNYIIEIIKRYKNDNNQESFFKDIVFIINNNSIPLIVEFYQKNNQDIQIFKIFTKKQHIQEFYEENLYKVIITHLLKLLIENRVSEFEDFCKFFKIDYNDRNFLEYGKLSKQPTPEDILKQSKILITLQRIYQDSITDILPNFDDLFSSCSSDFKKLNLDSRILQKKEKDISKAPSRRLGLISKIFIGLFILLALSTVIYLVYNFVYKKKNNKNTIKDG
jgi:hypothetical protein